MLQAYKYKPFINKALCGISLDNFDGDRYLRNRSATGRKENNFKGGVVWVTRITW